MPGTASQPYFEVLNALLLVRPRPFLMGGFAEDALLHGRVTRQRNDLDLLVDRTDWPEVSGQLRLAGLPAFEPSITAPDGASVALASCSGDLPVEAWLCDRSTGGYNLILPSESGEGGTTAHFCLLLPPDTFEFPASELGGVTVQTVSPLALARLRAASAKTRGTDEKRAVDRRMVSLLAERFLLNRDAGQLLPQLTPLQ